MLNEEEKAAFLQSIEQVRRRVAGCLGSEPGAARIINFVASLHASVDKVMRQADQRGLSTDCQAGCAYCCSVRVEASPAEIFMIARALRQWPAPQLRALLDRLRHHVAATDAMGNRPVRIDCAFLEGNLCAIYAMRPSTCRKAHSVSVACCAMPDSEIPQHLDILLGAEALMKGSSEACRDLGLDASAQELCQALLRVLTDDSAESGWCRGARVFVDMSKNSG